MHIILIVLVVFRAAPRILWCRQIADPPFQVVGRDLAEWPQCVALESRRSNQTSAGAGPPTISSFNHQRKGIEPFSTAGHPMWLSFSAYVALDLHTWRTIADQNRPSSHRRGRSIYISYEALCPRNDVTAMVKDSILSSMDSCQFIWS